jgi:hypothetical protein
MYHYCVQDIMPLLCRNCVVKQFEAFISMLSLSSRYWYMKTEKNQFSYLHYSSICACTQLYINLRDV